jgi:5'-nucleotidase
MKKIVYVDMDNVLVDFKTGIAKLTPAELIEYEGKYDEVPHIFSKMEPVENAIESYITLCSKYDTYILSTSPWESPTALNDKLDWVKKHLGTHAHKRLILSHNKHLNHGEYLIDDRTKNGADKFVGELILFGSEKFPNWNFVIEYLVKTDENN